MKGWEIVITDVQFYVGLASILGFGWSVFKFILNARLAILEKEVEHHKDEITKLKADHSKFRDDHMEIKISMREMSQNIDHILKTLDELNTNLKPMREQIQANSLDIKGLQH